MEDLRIIVKVKRGPKPEIVAFMEGKEVKRLMGKYGVTCYTPEMFVVFLARSSRVFSLLIQD